MTPRSQLGKWLEKPLEYGAEDTQRCPSPVCAVNGRRNLSCHVHVCKGMNMVETCPKSFWVLTGHAES